MQYSSLSVCLSTTNLGLQAYEAAYERYQSLQCYKGTKIETTAFERYGVKTIEKANMHNAMSTGLP